MWSHEIPRGEWMHVAIVNDPADGSVVMYVEGAPVLRNGVDNVGLNYVEGAPWVLGMAGWESLAADGWLGSIGEVRLVDHPVGPQQWLTARASGTPGPDAGDIPVTADIPGLPGAGDGPGTLAFTVAPGSVDLGEARNRGDRLALTGSLPGVTVTDTRPAGAWTVTGRASDLAGSGTAQGATVPAAHLGWAPHLVGVSSPATTAVPGERVAPALAGGAGLAGPARLASGTGQGSASLGADLELQVPVDTTAGGYAGTLTVSLFPQD